MALSRIEPTSIELFAGCGGLAIGTAFAGFKHLSVMDWNADAIATLKRNQAGAAARLPCLDKWSIQREDLTARSFKEFAGKANFVFGGPPCQPFSLGGKHQGPMDQRDMFPVAVRAVREIKPAAFMFENVRGLLRQGFSNYFQYIIQQLRYPDATRKAKETWEDHKNRLDRIHTSDNGTSGLRYNVIYSLMNAADYGVPQKRERVFIVGIRSDLGMEFSFPKPTHHEEGLFRDKFLTGTYWDQHKVTTSRRPKVSNLPEPLRKRLAKMDPLLLSPTRWHTVRDQISTMPDPKKASRVGLQGHVFVPGAKSYPGHTGSPWDEPSKTLKAGDHGVPGGENMLRDDDGAVRYFTVREAARLQTFPDEWIFEGAWTEAMRQIGNAVPARLAETVAAQLLRTIHRRH